LEFNPERYVDELSLTKKEEIQMGELAEKKTELIKKFKGVSSAIEKREISEEIKAINNFVAEKVRPIKYELNKKIEKEEEKIKQAKVYTFREFPYCFFPAKELQNLLTTPLPLTPLR
jgi:tyrosyl-tRNA synthetase